MAPEGYLRDLLADGARPFRHRARVRVLLGLPEDDTVRVGYAPTLAGNGFRHLQDPGSSPLRELEPSWFDDGEETFEPPPIPAAVPRPSTVAVPGGPIEVTMPAPPAVRVPPAPTAPSRPSPDTAGSPPASWPPSAASLSGSQPAHPSPTEPRIPGIAARAALPPATNPPRPAENASAAGPTPQASEPMPHAAGPTSNAGGPTRRSTEPPRAAEPMPATEQTRATEPVVAGEHMRATQQIRASEQAGAAEPIRASEQVRPGQQVRASEPIRASEQVRPGQQVRASGPIRATGPRAGEQMRAGEPSRAAGQPAIPLEPQEFPAAAPTRSGMAAVSRTMPVTSEIAVPPTDPDAGATVGELPYRRVAARPVAPPPEPPVVVAAPAPRPAVVVQPATETVAPPPAFWERRHLSPLRLRMLR